jgi:hypothetical protein
LVARLQQRRSLNKEQDMMIASRIAFLSVAVMMAGACVNDVENVDDVGADDFGDEPFEDADAEISADQFVPEVTELGRLDEPTHDERSLIAAGSMHAWSITVVRGVAGLGATFGDGNAPDLYVKRACGGAYRNRTLVKPNTTFPFWNHTLLAASQTDEYIKSCSLELWDDDANGDDYGGKVYLRPIADEMIRNGWKSMTRKVWFTANDDVLVYVTLTRR